MLSAPSVVAAGSLPNSFVLLPLSSFAINATLVTNFSCSPSYASAPCSGHGACFLLLNAADNTSQPLLNVSSARPLPAASSALDTYGIDNSTRLPAAVCVCDSGWTGRGDYLSHGALDGDSCGIDQTAVDALCAVGIVLFTVLLLLALHRLSGWLRWYRHSADGDVAAILLSQISSDAAPEPTKSHRSRTNNGVVAASPIAVSPRGGAVAPLTGTGTGSPFHYNTGKVKSPTAGRLTATHRAGGSGLDGGPPTSRAAAYRKAGGGSGGSRWAAFGHISFVHPLCSILFALSTAVFFLLRLTTHMRLGDSYVMSALAYASQNAYYVGVCVATYHTLRLAASITRTQTGAGGLSAVIRRVRVAIVALVGYSLVAWLLMFLLPSFQHAQQTTSVLVLTVLHLPVWAIAVLSLTATRRITATLVQHIDKLSAQQREARMAVYRKLRSQSNTVLVMVTLNVAVCLVLASSSFLRQSGQPYMHLFTQYFCWLTLSVRLLLIQPPGGAAATVAPHSPPAALSADAKAQRSPSHNSPPAAPGQSRQLKAAAGSAMSNHRPPSTVDSALVAGREEERSRVESASLGESRELTRLGSSAEGADVDVVVHKPRLSIVTDVD